MAEKSIFWTTDGTGDGAEEGYADSDLFQLFRSFCPTANLGGVAPNVLNELEVTGTATPVSVASGQALVYGIPYFNSAAVNVTIPTPAAFTRIDRIVLRADWTAQTVRITRIAGSEGGSAPALTQTAGTTWDIPLAQVSVTTGGVITVTDEREWVGSVGPETITSDMLADDAVTAGKIAAGGVVAGNIADNAIDPSTKLNGTNGIVANPANGNARGTDAVDLQTVRAANDQVASGIGATIGGGSSNKASASYSGVPMGLEAHARLYGQMAHASGKNSVAGDAQRSAYVARRVTQNATPTELFLDGSGASQRLTIPLNTTWAFQIFVAAKSATNVNQSAGYKFEGVIDNNIGTVNLVGTVTKTVLAEDVAGWDVAVTDANSALTITVTGEASNTIYWVASIYTTEVSVI